MPVKVQWLCEGRVIYVRFSGDMTLQAMSEFSTAVHNLIDSSSAPLVHMISDAGQVDKWLSLRDMLKRRNTPPRLGWVMMIGLQRNPMMSFIAHIVVSIFRTRYRDVDTLDEALEFLQKVDAALPNLQQYRQSIETTGTRT